MSVYDDDGHEDLLDELQRKLSAAEQVCADMAEWPAELRVRDYPRGLEA
jgi:hypothetical protein